jgi:hypothetical protein
VRGGSVSVKAVQVVGVRSTLQDPPDGHCNQGEATDQQGQGVDHEARFLFFWVEESVV